MTEMSFKGFLNQQQQFWCIDSSVRFVILVIVQLPMLYKFVNNEKLEMFE